VRPGQVRGVSLHEDEDSIYCGPSS
jgi:hypothetical protein